MPADDERYLLLSKFFFSNGDRIVVHIDHVFTIEVQWGVLAYLNCSDSNNLGLFELSHEGRSDSFLIWLLWHICLLQHLVIWLHVLTLLFLFFLLFIGLFLSRVVWVVTVLVLRWAIVGVVFLYFVVVGVGVITVTAVVVLIHDKLITVDSIDHCFKNEGQQLQMRELQYRVWLRGVKPIGPTIMTTYYVSFNTSDQAHNSPHIHGKLTPQHPQYPWIFTTASAQLQVRFHQITHYSDDFTLVGSSLVELEGQQGEEEFQIFGCMPSNQGKRVAEIDFAYRKQVVAAQQRKVELIPQEIYAQVEQIDKDLNTIIEELQDCSQAPITPQPRQQSLLSHKSMQQDEPLPYPYPQSQVPVRKKQRHNSIESVHPESEDEWLLQQMQDNSQKWYRFLFGKRKPQMKHSAPYSLSQYSKKFLLYYEDTYQWLAEDHVQQPHLLLKHMIVSPESSPIRAVEYYGVEWKEQNKVSQTKVASNHSLQPVHQWRATIRLPVNLQGVSIQAITQSKKKIRGLVMLKQNPKAAIQMYDQDGAFTATATYSAKEVNQIIIQTSSFAIEQASSNSKGYSDSSLNRSFRMSKISADQKVITAECLKQQAPVSRKLTNEEYLFNKKKKRSQFHLRKPVQNVQKKNCSSEEQKHQKRARLNNKAYLAPNSKRLEPSSYTLPPLHTSMTAAHSQQSNNAALATISHSQGASGKLQAPPPSSINSQSQLQHQQGGQVQLKQQNEKVKNVDYFLQNDDLIMINPPQTQPCKQSQSSQKSSIVSEFSQQGNVKQAAQMKPEGVKNWRVITVPQVMSIKYQPPPRPAQQLISPVSQQEQPQEEQKTVEDGASQYSASTIGTTGRTLHIDCISVHQYQNISGDKFVKSSITQKGVHETAPAPKSVNLQWVCQGHLFPHLHHKDVLLLHLCQCPPHSYRQNQFTLASKVIATAGIECRGMSRGESVVKGFLMREGRIVGEIVVQYHITCAKLQKIRLHSERRTDRLHLSEGKTRNNMNGRPALSISKSMSHREESKGRLKQSYTVQRQHTGSLEKNRGGKSGDGLRQILQKRRVLMEGSSKATIQGKPSRVREKGVRKGIVAGALRNGSSHRLFGEWH